MPDARRFLEASFGQAGLASVTNMRAALTKKSLKVSAFAEAPWKTRGGLRQQASTRGAQQLLAPTLAAPSQPPLFGI